MNGPGGVDSFRPKYSFGLSQVSVSTSKLLSVNITFYNNHLMYERSIV